MDECTANVDTQTASAIQNAISTECRGVTVITIAHRISMVVNVDNILILDNGNLVCFILVCHGMHQCATCFCAFIVIAAVVDSFVFPQPLDFPNEKKLFEF